MTERSHRKRKRTHQTIYTKNAEFIKISHPKVKQVMEKINARPREKLNFLTPNECFYENII